MGVEEGGYNLCILLGLTKSRISEFVHTCQIWGGGTLLCPFNSPSSFRILNSFFLTIPSSKSPQGQVTFLKLLNQMTAAFYFICFSFQNVVSNIFSY